MKVVSLPDIRSAQFEYLAAALKYDTWREAAEAAGVTPSALSQGIAQVERRLNLTLFERQGRRQVATPEANVVNAFGERILAEFKGLARWAADAREGAVGTLSIGMIDTAAIHHFGDTLVEFGRAHPELEVRLVVEPSNGLLTRLRAGEVDAVVAVEPKPDERIELVPLIEEPLYVYAPPGVAVGRPGDWGPWVGFPPSSRTRARIVSALRSRGAGYDVIAESSQPAVLREMVQLGMGWCVLCETDAESEPHALARAHRDPIAHRTLALGVRRDRNPSPALSRLLERLISS